MAATFFEIPLVAQNQSLSITLVGKVYNLYVYWNKPANVWCMDMASQDGTVTLNGIPLVAGSDLLAQFAYLQIGGVLTCQTDGDPYAAPTFDNLGTTGHLYFVPNA